MTDTNGVEADLWHVESSSGEVLVVTIEQLDEAFNQGHVNEQTRVWQAGMPAAVSLQELLGLESEGAEETYAPAATQYPPAAAESYRPPARAAAAAPSMASAWPPAVVATNARPTASVPPPSGAPGSWQVNAVPSVMPTAFDVAGHFVPFAKPKSRSGMVLGLVGILAVAAGAVAYASSNGDSTTTAAASMVPAPVPDPVRSHAFDPGSEPLHLRDVPPPAEMTAPTAPVAASATPHVDENLSLRDAALKAANTKSKSRVHAKAVVVGKGRSHGKSNVAAFKTTKGGSKYDPLNGSL